MKFTDIEKIKDMDAVIVAVAHNCFKALEMKDIEKLFGNGEKVLVDVKGIFDREKYEAAGYTYWRL